MTGSHVNITVPTRSVFNTIKRGLLWSNVYPFGSSINTFINGHKTDFEFPDNYEGLEDMGAITEDVDTGEIKIHE